MFVVYLELLVVTSRLPVCTHNHAASSVFTYLMRSCASSLLWVTAMASFVCVIGNLRAFSVAVQHIGQCQLLPSASVDHMSL